MLLVKCAFNFPNVREKLTNIAQITYFVPFQSPFIACWQICQTYPGVRDSAFATEEKVLYLTDVALGDVVLKISSKTFCSFQSLNSLKEGFILLKKLEKTIKFPDNANFVERTIQEKLKTKEFLEIGRRIELNYSFSIYIPPHGVLGFWACLLTS